MFFFELTTTFLFAVFVASQEQDKSHMMTVLWTDVKNTGLTIVAILSILGFMYKLQFNWRFYSLNAIYVGGLESLVKGKCIEKHWF